MLHIARPSNKALSRMSVLPASIVQHCQQSSKAHTDAMGLPQTHLLMLQEGQTPRSGNESSRRAGCVEQAVKQSSSQQMLQQQSSHQQQGLLSAAQGLDMMSSLCHTCMACFSLICSFEAQPLLMGL